MLRYVKINIILGDHQEKPLDFLGSTLRGAFGIALKKVVCINPKYECLDCFALKNCLYYDFFEQKNKPHTYRFSKPLKEDNFNFSINLFEEACEKLPYVLSALVKMVTELGLGVQRQKFTIENILCNDLQIYKNGTFDFSHVTPRTFESDECASNITLHLSTPLRMKHDNKLLNTKPNLELILTSVMNRLNEIKDLPQIRLPYKPSYRETHSSIVFTDLTRYSNRQHTKMQLGGIKGHISYKELDERSYMLLKLGEILGVGKQTVFGLGEISIEKN